MWKWKILGELSSVAVGLLLKCAAIGFGLIGLVIVGDLR